MEEDSNIKDVAEKILKGLSKRIKETRIWGPSSKFPGQIVGLNHKLKDLDVVELKTR
jgi:ribosome-interacting GTPase 1